VARSSVPTILFAEASVGKKAGAGGAMKLKTWEARKPSMVPRLEPSPMPNSPASPAGSLD
jgi:hypothetical protein